MQHANHPLGLIDICHAPQQLFLQRVHVENGSQARNFVFKIIDKATGKDFFLDAKTQTDLLDWMRAINQAVADNIANVTYLSAKLVM